MADPIAPNRWLPATRAALNRLITDELSPGTVVVLDFDNTVICRDIGDATFEAVVRDGRLSDPALLDGTRKRLLDPKPHPLPPDVLLDHYNALQHAVDHQGRFALAAVGYAWIVQSMAGLTPAEVVQYTEHAWNGRGLRRYRAPFVYPEMADLLGALIRRRAAVHLVSASNPWTVRWVVHHALNPMLAARHGAGVQIPPDHVHGLSTLVQDRRTSTLYTDPYLARTDPAYATLDAEALSRYVLTPHLVPPLSTYGGKVGIVLQYITDGPVFLAAGDSLNDLALLNHARHRLWLARLDRPDLQEDLADRLLTRGSTRWLVQPVRTLDDPGFVPSADGASLPFSAT